MKEKKTHLMLEPVINMKLTAHGTVHPSRPFIGLVVERDEAMNC